MRGSCDLSLLRDYTSHQLLAVSLLFLHTIAKLIGGPIDKYVVYTNVIYCLSV